MPIYAYKCSACGFAKDVLQKMSDAPLTECPACGASAFSKQLTAAGFQLKGSGWYVTDFRDGGGQEAAPAKAQRRQPATPTDGAAKRRRRARRSARAGCRAAASAPAPRRGARAQERLSDPRHARAAQMAAVRLAGHRAAGHHAGRAASGSSARWTRRCWLLPERLAASGCTEHKVRGLGVLLTLAILLVVGATASNFVGKRLLGWGDAVVRRIPVVRSIYSSVKQVSDTLFSESGNAFRTAVLVQWPRDGVWTIAFVTGTPGGDVRRTTSAAATTSASTCRPRPTPRAATS